MILMVGFDRAFNMGSQGQRLISPLLNYFMMFAVLALPSAGALWMAIRRSGARPRRRLMADALICTVVFLVLLPIGAAVAALPDLWHLLRE